MTSKFHELSDKLSQNLAILFLVDKNMKKIQKQTYEARETSKNKGRARSKNKPMRGAQRGRALLSAPPW